MKLTSFCCSSSQIIIFGAISQADGELALIFFGETLKLTHPVKGDATNLIKESSCFWWVSIFSSDFDASAFEGYDDQLCHHDGYGLFGELSKEPQNINVCHYHRSIHARKEKALAAFKSCHSGLSIYQLFVKIFQKFLKPLFTCRAFSLLLSLFLIIGISSVFITFLT